MKKTLTMIMAGGKGERLYPLTRDRTKPAVPFGGIYRIIDFTLSNCLNSGIRWIHVLTQYKGLSLHRHISRCWNIFNPTLGEFIELVPPQQRVGDMWYQGTADAVFQNLYTINQGDWERVMILSGDHVYKMDYGPMIEQHKSSGADLTIAVIAVERDKAASLGVMQVDENNKVVSFQEKPEDPATLPNDPERCLVSMGIYIFSTDALVQGLVEDAKTDSEHDFGKNIIPKMIGRKKIMAFPFVDLNTGDQQYWRDIGTIDSYWKASMDMISVNPGFNMYDRDWPIHAYRAEYPPPKTVFAQPHEGGRVGSALDSMVSNGCIISGGRVNRCILSCNVRINSYSDVKESVLFENVTVGRYAKIKRAIIDKGVDIPHGMQIGYDRKEDANNFTVTDSGIVVVPRGMKL